VNTEWSTEGQLARDNRQQRELPMSGEQYRRWEVAGASHVTHLGLYRSYLISERDETGVAGQSPSDPVAEWNETNREFAGQYGEDGGSSCPQNYFPLWSVYNAAFARLREWIEQGRTPDASDPIAVTDDGRIARDADGNARGGLRLPPVETPVATYLGTPCEFFGKTVLFDPARLRTRYDSHDAYVAAFEGSAETAVDDGFLLEADKEYLVGRAEDAAIAPVLDA